MAWSLVEQLWRLTSYRLQRLKRPQDNQSFQLEKWPADAPAVPKPLGTRSSLLTRVPLVGLFK